MKPLLRVLCVFLCVLRGVSFSLDRNAFTFTHYDLQVHVDPPKSLLHVTGTLTLRNDSAEPQKYVDLQVSSSFDWTSIRYNGKPVQYLAEPYVTDIDHTGSVSEAIVTLPAPIPPKGTLELQVAYEGPVTQDTTRLTRMDVPPNIAAATDWDQVSTSFTALRGIGYVCWYPVAMDSANLSDGNGYFDALGAWRVRESDAGMMATFWSDINRTIVADGIPQQFTSSGPGTVIGAFSWPRFGPASPSFAVADFQRVQDGANIIYGLPGHGALAPQYLAAARALATRLAYARDPHVTLVNLPAPGMAPYESGSLLFAPLQPLGSDAAQLLLARPMFRGGFNSPRPWVEEGLAHFSQSDVRSQQAGRPAALDYMKLQLPAIFAAEQSTLAPAASKMPADSVAPPGENLLVTGNEALYGSKAMYVWWMLRDMIGPSAFASALASYKPELDRDPAYVQQLFERASGKKLDWFFDDWVYHDRGLPDFRPGEIYARPLMAGSFVITVVVHNKGGAGAEVPVTVQGEHGLVTQRVLVPAHGTGTVRISIPSKPVEVTINDGSVPEWDLENNSGKAPSPVKTPPQ